MQLPTHVQDRVVYFKKQMLHLVAAKVFSVVMVCQIFSVSRNTFYKYRRLERAGQLAYISCAPRQHGLAKSQAVKDAVLQARAQFPGAGKKRLAQYLRQQGIPIAPNTVQRILRAANQALPAPQRRRRHWHHWEAWAPNVLWAIDICYLYTQKQDGFDLYLITILDDHSRKVVASGLFPQQTVVEVAQVLQKGVLQYGVPQVLVCDNGSQFTCSEFRRICTQIDVELLYAPKHYPQYKGKLERFFRTTRQEMDHATALELARPLHDIWIANYNHHRVHSSVVDGHGHAHVPQFRFTWKPSAAKSLPAGLDLEPVFQVQPPQPSAHTRQVKADQCIRYKKLRYHFPQLHKGDVVQIKEHTDQIHFFYQDHLLQTVAKPPRCQAACTRKVKAGGVVLFQRQRIALGLPIGTLVLIVREGQEQVFYADGHIVFRSTGQESVQQSI